MREYELLIDEALKNGLSPVLNTPVNTQVLYKCLGFKLGKLGLRAYKELENPLPVTVDMFYSWPFPQMVIGETYNILVIRDDFAEEDLVYVVSDDNSTATQIFAIDVLTFGQGDLMDLADFGEYAIMTNGVIMIYWDPTLAVWQGTAAHANIPMMGTICNFKGQLVGGNVKSVWHDCDETFYVWSKIGDIDCTPDRKNTAGYRRCPYGGEVMNVRRLGDVVIGYSDKGITMITPVSEPVATFGFKEIYGLGIINKGAIGGDLQTHVFVDEDYNLVKVEQGKSPEVLGYQKHMKELEGEDIIVTYDSIDFYIGNSSKTFLLSDSGLTEIPQHPSAVWRRDKESYMIPETVDDYDPLIVSEPFNMGYSGEKTVATLETDAYGFDEGEVAVDWANNIREFVTEGYSPINENGSGNVDIASDFFRFRLKFDSVDEDFIIGYMKARYKMTDLRSIRGVYAPPPRGQ